MDFGSMLGKAKKVASGGLSAAKGTKDILSQKNALVDALLKQREDGKIDLDFLHSKLDEIKDLILNRNNELEEIKKTVKKDEKLPVVTGDTKSPTPLEPPGDLKQNEVETLTDKSSPCSLEDTRK